MSVMRRTRPPTVGVDQHPYGTRPKTVLTHATGEVEIEVPRDRDGTFDPVIVKKRQREAVARGFDGPPRSQGYCWGLHPPETGLSRRGSGGFYRPLRRTDLARSGPKGSNTPWKALMRCLIPKSHGAWFDCGWICQTTSVSSSNA